MKKLKKLTSTQAKRLEPLLKWKGARQRIIMYLFALGYRVPDLVLMTVDELLAIGFPDYLEASIGELMDSINDERMFLYPRSISLRQSPRKEIIHYLLSQGYTVAQLQKTRMSSIKKIEVPESLIFHRDKLAEVAIKNLVFAYPSGKAFSHTDFYRLVRNTTEKVFQRKMSQDAFHRYIVTGKLD